MRVLFAWCLMCCVIAVTAPAVTDVATLDTVGARFEADAPDVHPTTIVLVAAPAAARVGAEGPPPPSYQPASATTMPPVPTHADTPPPQRSPTTTPKPTPAPTPRPAPSPAATPTPTGGNPGRDEVKAEIRANWGGDANKAIGVADCESGLNPGASSPSGTNLGLWQFTLKTWHDYGGSGDPRDSSAGTQTSVAWKLYQQQGWSPWAGCA